MAESVLTLPDLIKINDRNLADTDVPDFLNRSSFMRTNAATVASQNTVHKYLTYTNPQTGFRDPNDGREVQVSQDVLRQVDLKILDASFRTDLALADEFRMGRSAWATRETRRSLDDAFFSAEKQVFQGAGNDAKGFAGLPDNTQYQGVDGKFCLSAGGATNLSSVWLIRSSVTDVEIVTGMSGNIRIEPPTTQEHAGATGTFPAMYVPIFGWYGLKLGAHVDRPSAVRIANVDISSGSSNPMTDTLFYQAYAQFAAGYPPTHVYCHRLALEQWRGDRTTYNPIGTPAPLMESIESVQILSTDGIGIAESAVL